MKNSLPRLILITIYFFIGIISCSEAEEAKKKSLRSELIAKTIFSDAVYDVFIYNVICEEHPLIKGGPFPKDKQIMKITLKRDWKSNGIQMVNAKTTLMAFAFK